MAATTEAQSRQNDKPLGASPEPADGLVLEADYEEDRPNPLLAERQREFQQTLRGHYGDAEMPPA